MASVVDADGFLGVQIDAYGEQDSGVTDYEMHHSYGFIARPLDPAKDNNGNPNYAQACRVLYAFEGSVGHAWLSYDSRVIPKIPLVDKGGSAQYGATGSFHLITGTDGSQTIYVPYSFDSNGVAAKSMSIVVDVSQSGEEAISIIHGDGMAIFLHDGKVVLKGKSGATYIQIDDTGVIVNGNLKVVGGFQFGGAAGVTPLLLEGQIPSTMGSGA